MISKLFDLLIQLSEFVIFTVVIKMIIGHWLAEQILKVSKIWFAKTERNMAIWTHYQLRAMGQGHNFGSVLHCTDEKCQIF